MSNLPANVEKIKSFGALLESRRETLAKVLPRHINPDRLIKVALVAMSRSPLLLQCTQTSMMQAMMIAAQLGLEPDGVLGSAYLVPYRNNKTGQYEAQLIPGYRGLIDLARRSGRIRSIEAHLIRNGDKFECSFGLEPKLSHSPVFPGDAEYLENKNIIGAYAVAKLTDGADQFEVMSRAEIDAIRGRSRAKDSGPWVTDFGEMARKTVVRRLIKYLPLSVELASALDLDNRAENGTGLVDIIDLPPEEIPQEKPLGPQGGGLKEKLRGRPRKEPEVPAPAPEMAVEAPKINGDAPKAITGDQMTMIFDLAGAANLSILEVIGPYGVTTVEELTQADAATIIGDLQEMLAQEKQT